MNRVVPRQSLPNTEITVIEATIPDELPTSLPGYVSKISNDGSPRVSFTQDSLLTDLSCIVGTRKVFQNSMKGNVFRDKKNSSVKK